MAKRKKGMTFIPYDYEAAYNKSLEDVMECYDLGFSEMEWGTCRMVMLKDGKEGKPLKYEEIIEREMNMEKFSKHLENFNNGIMPQMQQEQDAAGQQDKGKRQETEESTEGKVQTRGAEHVPLSCGRQYISLRIWENGDLVM